MFDGESEGDKDGDWDTWDAAADFLLVWCFDTVDRASSPSIVLPRERPDACDLATFEGVFEGT
jgi:hypothetical protein